ncbi:MAG: prepilin peptidase [Candidatus Aenigmarchaeota archaeon]|nr:prepilin peptidase [Candidatus Aenigmarchaeota archaeon]
MVFAYIPLATAFIGATIATIWDLKTTEVPDQVPYAMIAIALLFYGYQSLVGGTFEPILNSLIYGITFLAFGALMYYVGQWGGADSLILGALGFLLPYVPAGFAHTSLRFPLSYLVNLFILGAVYLLAYGFVFSIRNKAVLQGFAKDFKAASNLLLVGLVGLFVASYAVGIGITKLFYQTFDFQRAFYISLYPFATTALLYLIWKFSKSIETYGFRKRISISKLKVGDMLMSEKKLVGVTENQIKALKRSGKRYVDIKLGVPFAPAFPLALLVTLLYGDLIFILLNFA